jgi:hypothetical protein
LGIWKRWSFVRQAKLNFLRFARMDGTPDEIAKGLALGIFIGMTPTFGAQMLLAVFFAFLLKENKLAAVLGVWITNPITAPFVYAFEYETGRLLLGMPRVQLPNELSFKAVTDLGYQVLVPLWFSGVLYGVIGAILAYALTLRFIPVVKAWHMPRWPRPRKKY